MAITKATASSIAPAAKGDLVVGSGTNDAAVLAVGSANQVLTVDSSTGTGLKWAAPSSYVGCSLFLQNGSVAFTQNVYKQLSGYTELTDTDGFHSTVTNTSRITIPAGQAGKYFVYGQFNSTTADYTINNSLYKNGAVLEANGVYNGETFNRPAFNRPAVTWTSFVSLAENDYLEYYVSSNWPTATYGIFVIFGIQKVSA